MGEIKENIIEFYNNYDGENFFLDNEELLKKYVNILGDEEKKEIAMWYSQVGEDLVLSQFIDIMHVCFQKEEAVCLIENLYSYNEDDLLDFDVQCALFNIIRKIADNLFEKSHYYFLMLLLSIKYECIYIIQKLLELNIDIDYINNNEESIKQLYSKLEDVQIKDYLEYYFNHKAIKEDCEVYFSEKGLKTYKPQYEQKVNDYFETEGLEDMERLLKSYNRKNLLLDNTPTEELRNFIKNEYNWDDGVAIPYFIMKHKNCSLDLKKELFELGAGDCLDLKEHSIYGKDPWERFIIELDEMIQSEEKGL